MIRYGFPPLYLVLFKSIFNICNIILSQGVIRINTYFYNNSYYALGYSEGYAKKESATVNYIYHEHSTDCYETVDIYGYVTRYKSCSGKLSYDIPNSQEWGCNVCGHEGGGGKNDPCPAQIPYQNYEKVGTKEQLKCGKTEDTIEKAIISY